MTGHDILIANLTMLLTAVSEDDALTDTQIDELGGAVAAVRALLREFKSRNQQDMERTR